MSLDIGFGLFATPRIPVFADPRTDNIQSRATLALGAGTINFPSIVFNAPIIARNGQGFYQVDTSTVGYTLGGTAALGFNNSGFLLPAAGKCQWSSSSSLTAAVDVSLSRVAAAQLGCDSDLILSVVGKGLYIKEGSNATSGTLTLNGTTEVTVSTTKVTANSRIHLTVQAPGGTPAWACGVSSRIAGTSFGVKGIALDTSTVAWLIMEPSP